MRKLTFKSVILALVIILSSCQREAIEELTITENVENVDQLSKSLHPDTYKKHYPVRITFIALTDEGTISDYEISFENIDTIYDLNPLKAENLATGFEYISNVEFVTSIFPNSTSEVFFQLPAGVYDFSKFLPYQSGRYFTGILENKTVISEEKLNKEGFVDITLYVISE